MLPQLPTSSTSKFESNCCSVAIRRLQLIELLSQTPAQSHSGHNSTDYHKTNPKPMTTLSLSLFLPTSLHLSQRVLTSHLSVMGTSRSRIWRRKLMRADVSATLWRTRQVHERTWTSQRATQQFIPMLSDDSATAARTPLRSN